MLSFVLDHPENISADLKFKKTNLTMISFNNMMALQQQQKLVSNLLFLNRFKIEN